MEFLSTLGTHPIFFAFSMVIMNLGSRYVFNEMTPLQEKAISSEFAKLIVTFFVFFVYSRDITLALILACFFTLTFRGIMNEKRTFNILNATITTTNDKYRTYIDNVQNIKSTSK